MINVNELLFDLCETHLVYDDNCELIDSGLLDSYAFIQLFSYLEDEGIDIQPTQIDRDRLRTPKLIKELIEEYKD